MVVAHLSLDRVPHSAKPVLNGINGVHLINLERRKDRFDQFFAHSSFPKDTVNIFAAIDKLSLTMTEPIRKMFEFSDYNYRRGIVACALSHFSLWSYIASTTNEFHLIFEDDAVLPPNFITQWNEKYSFAMPLDARLLYLGGVLPINSNVYHVGNVLKPVNRAFMQHIPTRYFSHDFIDELDSGQRGGASRRYFYTAVAYGISSDGARALVDLIIKYGFRRGADHMLYRLMDRFEQVYATHPLLVQPSGSNTDIQEDMLPVGEAPTLTYVTNGSAFNDIGSLKAVPTFVMNLDRSPDRMLHFALQVRPEKKEKKICILNRSNGKLVYNSCFILM